MSSSLYTNSLLGISGYAGVIWRAFQNAIQYAQANITNTNLQLSINIATLLGQAFRNGRTAINVYQLQQNITNAYTTLNEITALPLILDSATKDFLTARLTTLRNVSLALTNVVPQPIPVASAITANMPSIPFFDYTAFLMNFTYETLPAGASASNFLTVAQAAATAWTTIATALETQGVNFTPNIYDAVTLMGQCSQQAVNDIQTISLSSQYPILFMWNQLIAAPACLRYSSVTGNDPTQLSVQQVNVLKCMASELFDDMNKVALILKQQQPPDNLQLVTVRNGDTLINIAARALGNFELWPQIAALNNLVPPYISNTPSQGVAVPGQNLYLSPANGGQLNSSIDYEAQFLGTDIYYGPLNNDMNIWTGDFNIIQSYLNLAFSVGRRLQTTLESFVFHPEFGSRIPPEIGAVISSNFASYLAAYAESAILSDPRVDSIQSLTVTPNGSSAFNIQCKIIPKGYGNLIQTANPILVGSGNQITMISRSPTSVCAQLDVFIFGVNVLA